MTDSPELYPADLASCRLEIERMRRELEEAERANSVLSSRLAVAEARSRRDHEQFQRLRASLSWRLTAPLRLLMHRGRRGLDDLRSLR